MPGKRDIRFLSGRAVLSLLVLLLASQLISCARTNRPPSIIYDDALGYDADRDSVGITAFQALPPSERKARIKAAGRYLDKAHELEEREAWWWERMTKVDLNPSSIDELFHVYGESRLVNWTLHNLTRAVGLDPSNVEAWHLRARILTVLGDWDRAGSCYDRAFDALRANPREDETQIRLRLALDYAWLCRDMGLQDKALSLVDVARQIDPDDQEAELLGGLLKADAGLFDEAIEIAANLATIPYERFGFAHARSDYGSRWIMAMAYLRQGESQLAWYIMGEPSTTGLTMPYFNHYWNDMGLVSEMAQKMGEARRYYYLAMAFTPYSIYFPWIKYYGLQSIDGDHDAEIPMYLSYDRYYVCGSLYFFGTYLVAGMANSQHAWYKGQAASLAKSALDACINRGIMGPQALSVRAQYFMQLGEYDAAKADLVHAYEQFAKGGEGDAWTCMYLGQVEMNARNYPSAETYLRKAVAIDSTLTQAWRALGVAQINSGDRTGGRRSFDVAIEQDPTSVTAWYNRGLLSCNEGRWADACQDLLVATRLAPENEDAIHLLQAAGRQLAKSEGRGGSGSSSVKVVDVDALEKTAGGAPRSVPGMTVPGVGSVRRAEGKAVPEVQMDSRECLEKYRAEPSVENRTRLARAYLSEDVPDEALNLLLPHWNRDLTSEEMLIVLQIDRGRGDANRARQLISEMKSGTRDIQDPMVWALAAFICLDTGFPADGLSALDRAIELDPTNVSLKSYRIILEKNL